MGKEWHWGIELEGRPCEITCVEENNKYLLYLGDDYVKSIYRKFLVSEVNAVDEAVQIGGKTFRFVVWDGEPDLVLGGVFLRSGREYPAQRRKRSLLWLVCGWVLIVISALAILSFVMLLCLGEDVSRWVPALILSLLCLCNGFRYIKYGKEPIPN